MCRTELLTPHVAGGRDRSADNKAGPSGQQGATGIKVKVWCSWGRDQMGGQV